MKGWEWKVRIEKKWADLWIGAYWDARYSLGYEIDPRFPVRKTGNRTPFQRTNFDLWVCIVPCFPIHLSAWRPA